MESLGAFLTTLNMTELSNLNTFDHIPQDVATQFEVVKIVQVASLGVS